MTHDRQYMAALRFNNYARGQLINEAGTKLQQLIARGLVKEVKIAPPPEIKVAAHVKPRAKRKPKAKAKSVK